MPLPMELRKRHLLPRWRKPKVTAQGGEISPLRPIRPDTVNMESFQRAMEEFRRDQSLESAFDLVSESVVVGRGREALIAARFLSENEDVTPGAKWMASQLLADQEGELSTQEIDLQQRARLAIKSAKRAIRVYPWDPVRWVEMSRNYLGLGQKVGASRAMDVALSLAPNNRFVLRAAARLFVKEGDPGKAIACLDRSPATPHDPWLVAARIAAAQVGDLGTRFVKTGRLMTASQNLDPHHLSELAGTLGDIEMLSGNLKSARKYFRQSLVSPTENVEAQVVHVQHILRVVLVGELPLKGVCSFEANARLAYMAGRWKHALAACEAWMEDVPFSAGAGILGSFIAATVMEDYQRSARICLDALVANPGHPWLVNNLVVSYAMRGDVQKAKEKFGQMVRLPLSEPHGIVQKATEGLVFFRDGDVESGRRCYAEALASAKAEARFSDVYKLGLVHLAMEELRVDPKRGILLAEEADVQLRDVKQHPVVAILRERLATRARMAASALSDGSIIVLAPNLAPSPKARR